MSEESKKENKVMFDPDSEDQLEKERGACLEKDCHVRKFYIKLKECEDRVRGKSYTAENCSEETVDLIQAIDHCVGGAAFNKFE